MIRSDKHIQSREARKPRRVSRSALIGVGLIATLFIVVTFFVRTYDSLRGAILQERVDYVKEISTQIISSHLLMENEYTATVIELAAALEGGLFNKLDDIHTFTTPKDKFTILLMTESSNIVDLEGKHISMPSNLLLQRMLDHKGVIKLFTTLNFEQDCWLFAVPLSSKNIGGTKYQAVILSVSADEFRSNMIISLFDNRGASYIIGNDGRIKIQPLSDNLAFSGYNLFSSMISKGAKKADVDGIMAALQNGEVGNIVLSTGEIDWLVGFTPIDMETSIIVTIPLTLTAAQTNQGLANTIMLSSLSILIIALIAILLLIRFFRRDRAREKKALALAAKSDFYSKMSHDIRTPLNAVMGLVTLARENADDPECVRSYLEQSYSSANYLLSIINDVLEMSRLESGKVTIKEDPFDMTALLGEVKSIVKPLMDDKALQFTDEAQTEYPIEYIGDPVRIKQILTNLLSNAIKFTKPGGRVGLSVTSAEDKDERDIFTLVVSDAGIGMSEEFLKHIYTPFEQEYSSYTQHHAGSGLGLSITHELVMLMEGTLEVESRLGVGSTFTVRLPVKRGKLIVHTPQSKKRPSATFGGKRVLLAEDADINQMIAVKLLTGKFSIDVDVAKDGAAALQMFTDAPPGTYDMILMDIKMPNMDGQGATRGIRALPRPDAKSIPIIALSASTDKDDIALSFAAGMNDHLTKPLDIQALAGVFEKYFFSEG